MNNQAYELNQKKFFIPFTLSNINDKIDSERFIQIDVKIRYSYPASPGGSGLSQKKECKPHVPYTQHSLCLSWPGDFCHTQGKCIPDYDQKWDGHSFGIHGLWPSYDSTDISCLLNGKSPDPYCTYKYYFNEGLLEDLSQDLEKYWPQWVTNNYDSFHKNEWNKHGVCYLNLLKEKYGRKYGEDEIFHSYFQTAIALAKQHNTVTKFTFESKEELAKQLNIADPSTFYVSCKAGYINEIRLCYDIAEPGSEKLIPCFDKDLQSESRYRYPLKLEQKDTQDEN